MTDLSFEQTCRLAREVIIPGAIRNFTEHGEVVPASFVLGRRDPRTGKALDKLALAIVPLAGDKDAVRALQQRVCDRADAVAHIYVTEGWSVTLSDDAPFDDPYEGRETLEQHPDREEVILITLEHKDGGAMWKLPILRDGTRPTLGPLQEDTGMAAMQGRMTGYVRKQPEA